MPKNFAAPIQNAPKEPKRKPEEQKPREKKTTDRASTDETTVMPRVEAEPDQPAQVRRPGISRRALLIGAGAIVAATIGGVAWRTLAKDELPDAVDPVKESVNEAGSAPKQDVKKGGTYTVGKDIDAGIYTIRADNPDAEWLIYDFAASNGDKVWPAVPAPVSVTLSMQDGDKLKVAPSVEIVDAAPVRDLKDAPGHAGLFFVGTDIEPGTYELAPMTVDEWCTTEFGESAPVDELHPTLWHKTCARAASAARAAGLDIESWRGYILDEVGASGDVGATLDETSPAWLGLLSAEEVAIDTELEIEEGRPLDNYLVWMGRRGLVQVAQPVQIELKAGQVFAPVMCTVKPVE